MSTLTATPAAVDKMFRVKHANPGEKKVNLGQTASKPVHDAVISLEVEAGDQITPLGAAQSKAFVKDFIADVDTANIAVDEAQAVLHEIVRATAHLSDDEQFMAVQPNTPTGLRYAQANIDDATAGGIAHGSAQVIAYMLNLPDGNENDRDYEELGEDFLNSRRNLNLVEKTAGWTGPGELTAVQRLTAVDYFRTQAREDFESANERGHEAETTAHFFGRHTALEDAALKLSSAV